MIKKCLCNNLVLTFAQIICFVFIIFLFLRYSLHMLLSYQVCWWKLYETAVKHQLPCILLSVLQGCRLLLSKLNIY